MKGGGIAKLPQAPAEEVLKAVCPDKSIASWSIRRFASRLEGVIAVLSGMSTLDQVIDNCKIANEAEASREQETAALWKAMKSTGIARRSHRQSSRSTEDSSGMVYPFTPYCRLTASAWCSLIRHVSMIITISRTNSQRNLTSTYTVSTLIRRLYARMA